MTATAPDPATEATPMAHAPKPRPETAPAADDAPAAKPNRLALLGPNPLQTVLATAVVALLILSLTSNRILINNLDTKIDARFAEQDAKIDARFAEQDAKTDEINLKLTALIAALNMTEEVDAALEGRLLATP